METAEIVDRTRAKVAARPASVEGLRALGSAELNEKPIYEWFPYPVGQLVTEREMAYAEDKIGFRFPRLLRALYLEIGNGGFGPGYGLRPLFTLRRFGRDGESTDYGVISLYLDMYEASRASDIRDDDGSDNSSARIVPWPAMLLPIVEWGCAISSCVDCSAAPYRVLRDDSESPCRSLEHESFEEWWLHWLNGKDWWNLPAPPR